MKDLSITQEYLLCSINKNGGFPLIGKEQPVCFVAGALWELLSNDFVRIQDEKIVVNKELEDSFNYLSPMFELIKSSKPKTIKTFAKDYVFSLTEKDLKALIQSVSKSLVSADCAEEESKVGFLGNTNNFIVPKKESVDHVIQKIRAEILENGPISDETVELLALLSKGGLLKQYFSKYESQQLKERLSEIKNSESNQMLKEMLGYIDAIMLSIIASSFAQK